MVDSNTLVRDVKPGDQVLSPLAPRYVITRFVVFAFAMLIAGIVLHSKPARISAIVLLSVTIAKCFLHDLWRLGGLYRVASFVGLAICLTLVALLLQRFVLQPQKES